MKVLFSFVALLMALISTPTADGRNYRRYPKTKLPDGVTYYVSVRSFSEKKFTDCWRFGKNGILYIRDYKFPLVFEQAYLGKSNYYWQSVTRFGDPLAFNGLATGNAHRGKIKGNGINGYGGTFVFEGYPSDCWPKFSEAEAEAAAEAAATATAEAGNETSPYSEGSGD